MIDLIKQKIQELTQERDELDLETLIVEVENLQRKLDSVNNRRISLQDEFQELDNKIKDWRTILLKLEELNPEEESEPEPTDPEIPEEGEGTESNPNEGSDTDSGSGSEEGTEVMII